MDAKRAAEEIVNPLRMTELPSRPAFMEEKQITGAERGTLVHRALSLIPLGDLRENANMGAAIHRALHDMLERGIFTAQELLMMDMRGIEAFFLSEVGQRMLHAETVRREWSFNLVLSDHEET